MHQKVVTGNHMVMSISQPTAFKVTYKLRKKYTVIFPIKHIKFDHASVECQAWSDFVANIVIRLPQRAANGRRDFHLFNFAISSSSLHSTLLQTWGYQAKIQTLPVIGYDFSFVVLEIENRHTDPWVMDKDQRETIQQQQDKLQVIWSNEDRRTRSDEGWGTVLYFRWTPLDRQLCGSPSFIGNGAQSGDAQLNFNTRWNWWLCEWASFQR